MRDQPSLYCGAPAHRAHTLTSACSLCDLSGPCTAPTPAVQRNVKGPNINARGYRCNMITKAISHNVVDCPYTYLAIPRVTYKLRTLFLDVFCEWLSRRKIDIRHTMFSVLNML